MGRNHHSAAGPAGPRERRLERFAREEARCLYSFFRRTLGDEEMARDLLQDTYLDAWRNLSKYDQTRSFRSWVFGIGQNRLRNLLRRRRLEQRKPPLTGREERTVPEAESLVSSAEGEARLEAALLKLPHRQRVMVLLRYQEGLSCSEIGEIFSLTPNAVSLQLHRARRTLRDDLGDERSVSR